jgi:TonB family protein
VKSELDARLDAAWTQPSGLGAGSMLFVDVAVRVEPDGRISSARILKPSGHPELDASVRAALNRVRRVRAFPDGYSGSGETFEYRFQIK